MRSLLIIVVRRSWFLLLLFLVLLSTFASSQTLPGTRTVMVMPFENQSKAPGLEWIGEAFPEVLSQRLASPRVYVISREDRSYAFDHSGIPQAVRPSRATIYSVAEQMDADFVVLGTYDFDGSVFSASAQLLDMRKLHLLQPVSEKGALTDLIKIQTSLAWDLLQQMPNPPAGTREQFVQASAPIRLDAFEEYIRGTLATNRQQKIRYFHEALRLNPKYTLAMLQLGKAYFDSHEYESASPWFSRIPKEDAVSGEANFLLGMSEFYRGNYEKAYNAFNFLASRLPLTEIYNNLGVVESRRGHRATAVEYFTKAANADPADSDYRFNLAVALYKNGDGQAAARQAREELQRRPSDGETKSLLDLISRGVPPPVATAAAVSGNAMFIANQPRVPLERIKRNYDEASYRQLELEIHNLTEQRLAKTDRHSHSEYHSQRGKELLVQNDLVEAEGEFREAVDMDYNNSAAHAGLAVVLEKKGDLFGARAEAQTSVRQQPNVEALLVLARLNLKQNQLQPAADAVNQALKLEPANQPALELKNTIAAKQSPSVASH